MDALAALRSVDFDWTQQVDSVWQSQTTHVDALHLDERLTILDEFSRIKKTNAKNPPGQVIIGQAGSGKTHLLGGLRRAVMATGGNFILVDMTDVRDFWQTVLLGFLDSLEQSGSSGQVQYQRLVDHLFTKEVPLKRTDIPPSKRLSKAKRKSLQKFLHEAVRLLARRYRREVHAHQDVLRALLLLNSDHSETSNVGYSWLQGLELDAADQHAFGLRSAAGEAMAVVEGLSWLLSLSGPTLLAFDQLDAIVTEHHLSSGRGNPEQWVDAQRVSLGIIHAIAGGLMAIRDKTYRTLSVVACLDATWHILERRALSSVMGRFDNPMSLTHLGTAEIARELIGKRLEAVYRAGGFSAPYPSYPFMAAAFRTAGEFSPRQILRRCHEHRQTCLRAGRVTELTSFAPGKSATGAMVERPVEAIEARFQQLREQADLGFLNREESEDRELAHLIQIACRCLLIEQQARLPEHIEALVDSDFAGKGYRPLHARVRLIDRNQNDRERHFAFRVLQRTHATAFQNRLKAAVTASGIDRDLPFRHLVIIRTTPIPRGPKTQALFDAFRRAGGIVHVPSTHELRTWMALAQIYDERPHDFDMWLQSRRELCDLPLMQAARLCRAEPNATPVAQNAIERLTNSESGGAPAASNPNTAQQPARRRKTEPGKVGPGITTKKRSNADNSEATLYLGHRLLGDRLAAPISIPLADLTRHTVILAGAGSGKTVLVRRLTEEAALAGIPALVLDGANDLARLGSPWPVAPAHWLPEDPAKARQYFDTTETIVWTPGREKGNPLRLEPLPDLASLVDDSDELDQAVNMTLASLVDTVAPGQSLKSRNKRGILAGSLRYFASLGGQGLAQFIELLAELPAEAGGGIGNAPKLAQEMADLLRSEVATNPLLRQEGTVLDPSLLLQGSGDKTRISIVNLVGLPALAMQQTFVAQLAMTLFTWIKANPASAQRPLQGLLVIDEAKDFIPSGRNVSCKEPLMRLTAQARKYGLGLIFASQAPKSIDHNVIANCTTQFYGKASSPAAIEVVQRQLRQRGGTGSDIPSLSRGRFYVHSETLETPQKIAIPMCLSHHPATPPDEEGVLALAVESRRMLGD